MKRSESLNELAAALSKAQKGFEAAERSHTAKVETKTGGQYSFNYADLAAYLDVCRTPLGENGLSTFQEPLVKGDKVTVTTLLMHASGQWIESEPLELAIIATDSRGVVTPQAIGSAITYARRYSLSAAIGLASEADDDGNAASGNTAETGKREPYPECQSCKSNKAVIKGKEEYGGGWVCFAKKGGCGNKWQDMPKPDYTVDVKQQPKPSSRPASEPGITPDYASLILDLIVKSRKNEADACKWASGNTVNSVQELNKAQADKLFHMLGAALPMDNQQLSTIAGALAMNGVAKDDQYEVCKSRLKESGKTLDDTKPMSEQLSWLEARTLIKSFKDKPPVKKEPPKDQAD